MSVDRFTNFSSTADNFETLCANLPLFCEHIGVFDGESKSNACIYNVRKKFKHLNFMDICQIGRVSIKNRGDESYLQKVFATCIQPQVDFGLKVMGGDLMAIPGLYQFIQVRLSLSLTLS